MTSIFRSCRVVGGTVLLLYAAAWADPQRAGQDLYEEQLRFALDRQIPNARAFGFDYGAWLTFSVFDYDDPVGETDRTLRRYQTRMWGSANLRGVHRFYSRVLVNYDDWNSGDNPANGRGDDCDFEVERAWYEFSLGSLLRGRSGRRPSVDFRTKVGRQFVSVGTSFTLSMPLDAIRFDLSLPNWRLMGFLGRLPGDSRNICRWEPGSGYQRRCFYGFQATYLGIRHHRPFAYYFSQSDHTAVSVPYDEQAYDYSSRYLGVGSTGTLVLPRLRYRAELVGEWGRTYSNGANEGQSQDEICAWAANVALEYRLRIPTKPRIVFEYVFASGDPDRTSSLPAAAGNTVGTKDNAFNGLGFRDLGVWLSPRTSNLHMYSMDFSFFPYQRSRLLKDMQIGTKLFFFHKDRNGGPTSDTSAGADASCLGWEWDMYCNWRVTRNLTWTVRYGAFRPGAAYNGAGDSVRRFAFTGLVLGF